jgi:predicted ABC-type exoprotein transport system permease subunit
MTLQHIFNILGLLILLGMLVFQVWNFVRYRDTNGAQKKRVIFLLSTVLLIVHEVRLILGVTTGLFLLGHIVFLFMLFDMVRISEFIKWIRRK